MRKEVITLSFGSYASFVSAHYWNLQDEAAGYGSREGWSDYAACVDHDALFAEAEGRHGAPVYRPRAVLFDIAGSSGGVSFSADGRMGLPVGASPAAVPTWQGACEVHRAAPVARSPFLERLGEQEELDWDAMGDEEAARQQAALEEAARQLDTGGAARGGSGGAAGASGTARHWTDFCKVVFSPNSVYTLPGYWTSPYEHSLSSGWGAAEDLLGGRGGGGFGGGGGGGGVVLEDATDRVRYLAEGCDSLAGFQVWADDLTGFGALAASVLGEVVEEYTGRPLVLFSLRRPGLWEQQQQQGASLAAGPVSTAQSTARARDELSQALAVTRAAELASLYIPLAAPPAPTALPYLSYNATVPFHTSAILACAIDSALLPTRLTGARSPLGEARGGTDLHSLVRLLRPGGAAANLAALHLALPCPSLPADVRQLQRQLDERLRPPHASQAVAASSEAAGAAAAAATAGAGAAPAAGPRGQALYGSTAQLTLNDGLASLTPGISGRDGTGVSGCSRAESYCLRGARTDAGPASTTAALEALDLLLLRQPHRMCVRHRCATPMPLAVPLPFPQLFRRDVSLHGDILPVPPPPLSPSSSSSAAAAAAAAGAAARPEAPQGQGPGGVRQALRGADEAVHSAPVLTRLQATGEFEGWVRRVRELWGRAAGGAAGRAVLDGWGVGRDDAAEVGSQLDELAASFGDDDDEM